MIGWIVRLFTLFSFVWISRESWRWPYIGVTGDRCVRSSFCGWKTSWTTSGTASPCTSSHRASYSVRYVFNLLHPLSPSLAYPFFSYLHVTIFYHFFFNKDSSIAMFILFIKRISYIVVQSGFKKFADCLLHKVQPYNLFFQNSSLCQPQTFQHGKAAWIFTI